MRIQELSLLVTLADELHFGRTAERMSIAQPQLSTSIRRIEQEAGVTIFNRRPRVSLTPAGIELVETARRLLSDMQSGISRAQAIAAGQVGRVSLGFSPPAMCSDLPNLIRQFLDGRDDIELKLIEGTTGSLREQLDRGELDLVVSREPMWIDGLRNFRVAPDSMNLMLPEAHPAAAHEYVDPRLLADEEFIMFPRASAPHYYDRILLWCRDNGLVPRIARETESWMAVLGMIRANLGIAFGTELLSRIAYPGVVYRKFGRTTLDVSFWMSWDPERVSPAAGQLLNRICQRER